MGRRFQLFLVLCFVAIVFSVSRDGALALATGSFAAPYQLSDVQAALPSRPGSVKFAVLGGFGTGERPQYELAEQMANLRARFPYDTVILVGGNIYGSQRPQDFQKKFEFPYKPLLDAGVRFHASLGKDDSPEQRYYQLFNMNGQLSYTFSPRPDVRFFALASMFGTPVQVQWLEHELQASRAVGKIVFCHQPLYSSGEGGRSGTRLREQLEPLLVKHNVSVVLTGRDRFYERMKPQKGIVYFVVGSGGQLQPGSIDRSSRITARAFDDNQAFLAAEIVGDEMFFNAISRDGKTIDSGVLKPRTPTAELQIRVDSEYRGRGARWPR
jgi:Calcineurin-like phosphoesterase